MSTSRHYSESRAIPTRRVVLSDSAQLPHDYCTTSGGTLFSTTPGGTRIIYDRKFLPECRKSPVTRTPPLHLPHIPGVTVLSSTENTKAEPNNLKDGERNGREGKSATGDESQFEMDI
ncbi:eukaryotic translation initiation factor 4E binding protein 2 [Callorhinchus milii]|uniref:Eukaryotic translation initiation factor 4E-binding protein 2 n=1 Tax=Callorhinchus milii TaxID=7868 RepID=K4FYA2_CALMI|nr:eukaryotic translation initiation factor 4E-binding protein 2 [Callorhinchus milii]AFK11122.1 Eukaryotic translation initiation factor 4E-binding protein 2 [Callorhinchus milii]